MVGHHTALDEEMLVNRRDPVLGKSSPFLCPSITPGVLLFASLTTPVPLSAVQVVSGDLIPGSTVIATPR